MELHGGPMERTWVKLGRTASAKQDVVLLAEPVVGWKLGNRPMRPDIAEWEIDLAPGHTGAQEIRAHAEDEVGNVERMPHIIRLDLVTGREALQHPGE